MRLEAASGAPGEHGGRGQGVPRSGDRIRKRNRTGRAGAGFGRAGGGARHSARDGLRAGRPYADVRALRLRRNGPRLSRAGTAGARIAGTGAVRLRPGGVGQGRRVAPQGFPAGGAVPVAPVRCGTHAGGGRRGRAGRPRTLCPPRLRMGAGAVEGRHVAAVFAGRRGGRGRRLYRPGPAKTGIGARRRLAGAEEPVEPGLVLRLAFRVRLRLVGPAAGAAGLGGQSPPCPGVCAGRAADRRVVSRLLPGGAGQPLGNRPLGHVGAAPPGRPRKLRAPAGCVLDVPVAAKMAPGHRAGRAHPALCAPLRGPAAPPAAGRRFLPRLGQPGRPDRFPLSWRKARKRPRTSCCCAC